MAKKKSPAARTTIYRLRGLQELNAAIRPKYLTGDAFSERTTQVEGREALLVAGAMRRERSSWSERLSTLAGQPVEVGNETAAAVLVIKDSEDTAYALSYGMGFQLLEPSAIDHGFGMRIAVRTASPDAIQSLTRTELDHRSRTDRSSIPAGEVLRGFGIGDFGEIITRISGAAELPGLTAGSGAIRIRAADALSVPLGKTQRQLISDLDAISTVLELAPKPELQMLEQFVRVKQPAMIETLEASLRTALLDADGSRLALGWPHERVNENGTPTSHLISGVGRSQTVTDDLPALETLVAVLTAKNAADPLAAASTVKVHLFRDADGEEPISGAIPALNWLFFETTIESKRYCLFDSRWYAMDNDYADRLVHHTAEIFNRPPAVNLPDWDASQLAKEIDYNQFAAAQTGAAVLDQKLVKTPQHPRGFEACDLITPDGDLIHVKHTPKSASASHLIAQAVVSTDALRYDNDARTETRRRVAAAGGVADWVPDKPKSVVLGMARSKPINAADLFTFTQVTLTRLDRELASADITLTVSPILRTGV